MEEDQKIMTPLDQMVTPDSLQMIKALIPFLPPGGQRFLSAYAKCSELRNTIRLFTSPDPEMHAMSAPAPNPSFSELLQALKPYASGEVRDSLDNLLQTFSALSMFQAFSEMQEETPSKEVNDESEL